MDEENEYGADEYDDIEDQIGGFDDEDDEQDNEPAVSSVLDSLKGKKSKMYFDEELVKHLIIDEYQPKLEYGMNEKGKRVCISREQASKEVEKEIMSNLFLIANAIINKYRYWRFEPLEDLQAEALKAMWYYLPNFTPGKGSAFDLFSIICKRHLLNFTLKNYKHRIAGDIDVCFDVSSPKETNYPILFDGLEKTFIEIINRHYIGEKRKKYIELTSILVEYIVKNYKIVGKNDLMSVFKEYGYKGTEYKKFIDDMSKFKEEFYAMVA